jgi:hypothetical protein
MKHPRVLLTVSALCLSIGCTGTIDDPESYASLEPLTTSDAISAVSADTANSEPPQEEPEVTTSMAEPEAVAAPKAHASDTKPIRSLASAASPSNILTGVETLRARVGSGELAQPLMGPGPLEAAKLSGSPYALVKNWDFGKDGTIRNQSDLIEEFEFHDHWKTIANGTNYGAVTVAPDATTAIGAQGLGLKDEKQPFEDPARPTREWTGDSMLMHVRPLSAAQATVSADRHDAGNGSFMAKWQLPKGGSLLGHDLVWETRVRMPKPVAGYWFALWAAGTKWDKGAEMDVLESFGTPNISADAFHADSVGGSNLIEYKSWPEALDKVGVPDKDRELFDWHTWTWVYLRDDSYEIYYDGHRVQHGVIHWTHRAEAGAEPVEMRFLFDFSWGHTQVDDVDIELPASSFPLTYEIDYSRVDLR